MLLIEKNGKRRKKDLKARKYDNPIYQLLLNSKLFLKISKNKQKFETWL
jgi:hypothetical protein